MCEVQHPLIGKLANSIEDVCKKHLSLSPCPLPHEFDNIEGRFQEKKLVITNRCWQTPQFRKIHLQLARIGNSLNVLHYSMFPRTCYALPIYGAELVAVRDKISAAIVDISPCSLNRNLPDEYHRSLNDLPLFPFSEPRSLPEWADAFSEYCIFIRPVSLNEEHWFVSRAIEYLNKHCKLALSAKTVPESDRPELLQAQRHYCTKQYENERMRCVLESAFGAMWADRYLRMVLFDLPED